jgi:radical SAM superfamily enzyme YgiQ (UPF0313 family)
MAKKLLLINPVQETRYNLACVPTLRVPQVGLAYIAALTPSDWDIKIIDESIEPLTFEDADLVGITAFTCNIPRAYKIAEQYRRKGIKTVIGGVHASMLYEEAINSVDSVVIGEAESVWLDLIHDFESNQLKRYYKGERIPLNHLVTPRMDLYKIRKYRVKAVVQTGRGCPNDCEFCSVTTLYGRTYRQRPLDELLDELEAIKQKNVFLPDDNILGYGKKAEERAVRLFKGMIERGLKKRWGSQVGIDFANNPDVLKYAKKAGCLAVFIGFESLNEEALQGMDKTRNLKVGVKNYKEVIRKIHDHGIGVIGAFVFGSDSDRKDVFERTTEFIQETKLDAIQLSILTPLPGTRLYNRLKQEGRLLRTDYPEDWKYYDFMEVVFEPRHMSTDELKEGVTRIYKDTTSRATSLKMAFNSIIQTKNLYGAICAYLWNRGYGSVWMDKYEYMKTKTSDFNVK